MYWCDLCRLEGQGLFLSQHFSAFREMYEPLDADSPGKEVGQMSDHIHF